MTSDAKEKAPAKKPEAPKEDKVFQVRLLKNYRPTGNFKIIDTDEEGQDLPPRDPDGAELLKAVKGTKIELGLDDAKRAVSLKIAERADELSV